MFNKLVCKITVNNVPDSIVSGSRGGFMVARADFPDLWYYGCYETFQRATDVANELGNGIVIEVNNEGICSED